jgi:hypothetical protein
MALSDSLFDHRSSALRYPEWQVPYRAALLEFEPKKLAERVAEAEAAIFQTAAGIEWE